MRKQLACIGCFIVMLTLAVTSAWAAPRTMTIAKSVYLKSVTPKAETGKPTAVTAAEMLENGLMSDADQPTALTAVKEGEILVTQLDDSGKTLFDFSIDPAAKTAWLYNAYANAIVDSVLTVPDSLVYEGVTYPITAIGSTSAKRSGITSLSKMRTLVLGANIERIDSLGVYACSKLTEVTWNEKCHELGAYCFRGSGFTAFTLPKPVDTILGNPFMECTKLTTIKTAATTYFRALGNLLMDRGYTTLICYPPGKTTGTLNLTVKKVAAGACYGCTFDSIGWGTVVQEIGTNAFARVQCKYVNIPASTTYIGDMFNYYNSACISLTLDPDNTSFKLENGCLYDVATGNLVAAVWNQDNDGKGLVIPEGVKRVSPYLFYQNKTYSKITFPSTLESIESRSFYYTTAEEANFEDTKLSYIGPLAFQYGKFKSIAFPSTMRLVDTQGFYRCTSLESLTLNEGLEQILYCGFGYCTSLKEVELPSTLTGEYGVVEMANQTTASMLWFYNDAKIGKVTAKNKIIARSAFSGCGSIRSINLEEGVEVIGPDAFNVYGSSAEADEQGSFVQGYLNLDTIALPSTLKFIGDGAFQTNLFKSVTIPASCKYIAQNSFGYSSNMTSFTALGADTIQSRVIQMAVNLEEFNINEGCKYVGAMVCGSSNANTSFTIPASVERFGGRLNVLPLTTSGDSMKTIYSLRPTPPELFYTNGTWYLECDSTDTDAFIGVTRFAEDAIPDWVTVYVPFGCSPAYKADKYWGLYNIKEMAPENVYFAGQPNGWTFDTIPGNGSFVYTISDMQFTDDKDLGFKISYTAPEGQYDGWEGFNKGAIAADAAFTDGATLPVTLSDKNNTVALKGKWSFTVDLEAMTVSATAVDCDTVIYLRGAMNGWEPVEAYKFVKNDDGNYVLYPVTIEAGQEFKIADASYGVFNFGGQTAMDNNKWYMLANGSMDNCSLKEGISSDREGTVVFKLATGEVNFTQTDGIDSVKAGESGGAQYFTLQGVRVVNPQKGAMYIRVDSTGARTVLMK